MIQRFRCKFCRTRFSAATGTLEFGQKKRRVNAPLSRLLGSGVSLRRAAILLKVNRKTVERKLRYLGKKARRDNKKFKKKVANLKALSTQFDDLITKENSKLKPLSISLAVDAERRFILGAEVSQIPSFGHLSKRAKKKYGPRKCYHKAGLERLFKSIENLVDENAIIRSDEHQKYPAFVRRYFPHAHYEVFKSERACVAGQGELKKVKRDPLFTVNHTCAMLRANINRLIRKTWCTTKDRNRLKDHVDLFISFYNQKLLKLNNISLTPT